MKTTKKEVSKELDAVQKAPPLIPSPSHSFFMVPISALYVFAGFLCNLQNIQICRRLLRIFGKYCDLTLSEKVIYHVQTQLRYNAGQTWEADRIRKE